MELRYPAEQFALSNHRDVVRGPMTRVSFKTPVGDRSRTVQSETDTCDIHSILRRYQQTGVLTHVNSMEGRYTDFRDFPDNYQQAMNIVLDAQESFEALPSRIRDAFANDPLTFFQAVHDPAQQERLIELGVFNRKESVPKTPPEARTEAEAIKPAAGTGS